MPATDKIEPLIAANTTVVAADRGETMKEEMCKLLGLPIETPDEEVMAKALKALADKPADAPAVPQAEEKKPEALTLKSMAL